MVSDLGCQAQSLIQSSQSSQLTGTAISMASLLGNGYESSSDDDANTIATNPTRVPIVAAPEVSIEVWCPVCLIQRYFTF